MAKTYLGYTKDYLKSIKVYLTKESADLCPSGVEAWEALGDPDKVKIGKKVIHHFFDLDISDWLMAKLQNADLPIPEELDLLGGDVYVLLGTDIEKNDDTIKELVLWTKAILLETMEPITKDKKVKAVEPATFDFTDPYENEPEEYEDEEEEIELKDLDVEHDVGPEDPEDDYLGFTSEELDGKTVYITLTPQLCQLAGVPNQAGKVEIAPETLQFRRGQPPAHLLNQALRMGNDELPKALLDLCVELEGRELTYQDKVELCRWSKAALLKYRTPIDAR